MSVRRVETTEVDRLKGKTQPKGYLYSFERLRVWNEARELHKKLYHLTKTFPRSEMYGFTSQINRAAVSVAANLAEGCSRRSRKDQAHFTEIAYGSLTELACLLILAMDVELLSAQEEANLRGQIDPISRQLIALRNAQLTF
jgi:four helix bundle protein